MQIYLSALSSRSKDEYANYKPTNLAPIYKYANKKVFAYSRNLHHSRIRMQLCKRISLGLRHWFISTPWLNSLRNLHLEPINLVIYQEPIMILNLRDGFALICFQRLSKPNIAIQQCRGCDSWHTRGSSFSVLSY